jgi:hypothetical protein
MQELSDHIRTVTWINLKKIINHKMGTYPMQRSTGSQHTKSP